MGKFVSNCIVEEDSLLNGYQPHECGLYLYTLHNPTWVSFLWKKNSHYFFPYPFDPKVRWNYAMLVGKLRYGNFLEKSTRNFSTLLYYVFLVTENIDRAPRLKTQMVVHTEKSSQVICIMAPLNCTQCDHINRFRRDMDFGICGIF